MRILFVGGYGNISWWCTYKALCEGNEVYLLNRGETRETRREMPEGVKVIKTDYRNYEMTKQALSEYSFDVVCDFICYNEDQSKKALRYFANKTKQYIFISSESVYRRRVDDIPFSEDSPKYDEDKVSSYISDKIKAERVLISAYERDGFPVTIVRPGLTYDTIVPVSIGHNCFTVPKRCLDGKPLYIAGDGKNHYAFTNSRDFADLFYVLLGNTSCIGEDYNIADTRCRTWNEASEILLDVLKVRHRKIIHIPFEEVLKLDLPLAKDLMYERMLPLRLDVKKIRKFAPGWMPKVDLEHGMKATIEWLYERDAHRRIVSTVEEKLTLLDRIYGGA